MTFRWWLQTLKAQPMMTNGYSSGTGVRRTPDLSLYWVLVKITSCHKTETFSYFHAQQQVTVGFEFVQHCWTVTVILAVNICCISFHSLDGRPICCIAASLLRLRRRLFQGTVANFTSRGLSNGSGTLTPLMHGANYIDPHRYTGPDTLVSLDTQDQTH